MKFNLKNNSSDLTIKILFALFLLLLLLLNSCSSGDEAMNLKQKEGVVVIVGNEPFTKPALKVAPDTSYVIECSKEERKTFFENQGKRFKVYYSKIKLGPNGNTLQMKKFEILDK